MGFYIEVPDRKNKAQQIVDLYGGKIVSIPPLFEDITPDKAIICVVDNGPFEAAAFCYSQSELIAFSYYDGRSKIWIIMDRKKACKLTGYEESRNCYFT